ncbi:hypothetical protein BG011_004463 [Mortierella polycephala]|uniref:Diphthine--ammonia ligase n=1 Tax=Mortierella polycephala TaxID=41804 RepID=A0A9P6Q1J0_9FUNG|nr:hypothetical protein BG011_004463 [Mortierella polycephala]
MSIEITENDRGCLQTLKRVSAPLQTLATTVTVTSVITGVVPLTQTALASGGPVMMIFGFMFASAMAFTIALSLADIASGFPNVKGGLIEYTRRLAPQKLRRISTWVVTGATSCAFAFALFTTAVLSIATGVAPQRWVTVLIHILVSIMFGFINAVHVNIDMISGPIVVFLTIAASSTNPPSAEWVFTHFENQTGWSSSFYVTLLGLVQGAFTMTGYDAPIHTMHSTPNAAWKVPQGILFGFLVSFTMGELLILTILFGISDIDEILNPVISGIAPVEIFIHLISRFGTTCILLIFIGTFFFCGQGVLKACSEIGHELALSGAFPKSEYLSQVGPKGQPARVGWLCVLISSGIGMMYLVNTTILQALTSAVAIELNLAYSIPIALRLFFPNPTLFQPGPFSLGCFQRPVAMIAVAWSVLGAFIFSLPGVYPITAKNMNYASVLLLSTLAFIIGHWHFSARHWFDMDREGSNQNNERRIRATAEQGIPMPEILDGPIDEKELDEIENWLDHLERELSTSLYSVDSGYMPESESESEPEPDLGLEHEHERGSEKEKDYPCGIQVTFVQSGWMEDHFSKSRALAAATAAKLEQTPYGGKDSFYNLMQCVANGHTVIALGNLHPRPQDNKDELDSYMYQTVGHDVIHLYKDCLDLPLYRQEIKGRPIEQGSDYVATAEDETEDLYELLHKAKTAHPDLEAVSVGAILSNYQRIRVEHVCERLGLMTLGYLWQRNQEELLYEMAQSGVNAILIKIAAIGLKKQHLGQSIGDMFPYLCRMNQEYDLHICGEGGEYETITLDCPLFKRRIVVDESEIVIHSDDAFAQVAYLRFKSLHLEDKTKDELDPSWLSDMNLNPVWEADSVMMPIEDIVRTKQLLQETETESVQEQSLPLHHTANDDIDAVTSHLSKFSTHQSDIVCAIGGTTAHEMFSPGTKKHMSIAEETKVCLQNVQAKLERIGLSWTEVVFMQVFVSNMADFGGVNGAYKAFFGINPPPRACVGANLPEPIRIQVNCTAIRKGVMVPKPRQTLHVQGISYWAPANIGPYSQATEQAYHAYIAGQIGMIPSTLDLPEPPSLAKETAWSLRNLSQIATARQCDLINRTALCIAYVSSPEHFAPVTAAWQHIANKKSPAPLLAICMPSLPKGSQVEWQVVIHQGKVYADKAPVAAGSIEEQDGYETDDDDIFQLEKRALYPSTLSLDHEQLMSYGETESEATWKTRTQSWFLTPFLMALSVVHMSEASSLASQLSALSVSSDSVPDSVQKNGFPKENVRNMLAMMIKAMDRVLGSHITPAAGPGVQNGWGGVVAVTLYYLDTFVQHAASLEHTFEQFLSESTSDSPSNIAVTLVPVQAIADHGVLALTFHAVGKMPTIPGLLQA